MIYTPVYYKTQDAILKTDRFVSSCGGTRSGKTFAMLQCIFELAVQDEVPTITSVVSETFPHLKRGAIRDFQDTLGEYWDEKCWSKGESIYRLPNGSIIEFFSADSPAKYMARPGTVCLLTKSSPSPTKLPGSFSSVPVDWSLWTTTLPIPSGRMSR